jgi:hypothetical protein
LSFVVAGGVLSGEETDEQTSRPRYILADCARLGGFNVNLFEKHGANVFPPAQPVVVSMIQLLSHPEKYEGKWVLTLWIPEHAA